MNQWINAKKKVLTQIMERQAKVKELEQSISRLQKKQLDIAAVEQIEVKNVPLSSKVMIDRKDYQNLMTAAQKDVVQKKKTPAGWNGCSRPLKRP